MYKGGTAGKKELQERTICIQNKRVEALQAVFSRSNAVGNVEERERERESTGERPVYQENEMWLIESESSSSSKFISAHVAAAKSATTM